MVFKSCHSSSVLGCQMPLPSLPSLRLEFKRKRDIMETQARDLSLGLFHQASFPAASYHLFMNFELIYNLKM